MATLTIGNTSAPKTKKRWSWTFYVRGAVEYVSKVTIKLHPSFKKPVRTVTEAPFEFPSAGYGTFDIDVRILWVDGSELRTSWELQLDKADKNEDVSVPASAAESDPFELDSFVKLLEKAGEKAPTSKATTGASSAEEAAKGVKEAPPLPGQGTRPKSMPATPRDSQAKPKRAPTTPRASGTKWKRTPTTPRAREGAEEKDDAPTAPPKLLRERSGGKQNEDPQRAALMLRLRQTAFLPHGHPLFMHGRAFDEKPQEPTVLWKSTQPPRKDHGCPKWLTATEFEDRAETMKAKVKLLAALMRASRKTVAYTGAGISAAVIGQAALSGQNKTGWQKNTRAAKPTPTHRALGFLGQEGLIHGWVQQNHDGLPQKAGFPQENINEIHGSWYDPCNPVVKYSGTLHERSYPWMRSDAQTADLVLVLGTSLGGLNADQVAVSTAERSLFLAAPPKGSLVPGAWIKAPVPESGDVCKGMITEVDPSGALTVRFCSAPDEDDSDSEEERPSYLEEPIKLKKDHPVRLLEETGGGLGTVIINLQQTAQDGKATLRMFGKSDQILGMLLQELGFGNLASNEVKFAKSSRALVPYDANGRRLPAGSKRRMWLDLRAGQLVKITAGHNIQGAGQPQYMHIGGKKAVKSKDGTVHEPGPGLGTVKKRDDETSSFMLEIEGVQMRLGIWWLETAQRGGVDVLPIVNQAPAFEG
eukprot:TRINITY_DN14426_c0_g1_i12.p1 TRINITY_DN14426_c0_g1~~TRINITY_DN14426_c0_g1_i12.p1  ORF type:complete len:724 (+),score=112.19 TRINITY_DN14426_c0_g1_i12:75-2174(+)